MNNVFAITSGKGGVGKSTVATCIAAAAEKSGKRVFPVAEEVVEKPFPP